MKPLITREDIFEFLVEARGEEFAELCMLPTEQYFREVYEQMEKFDTPGDLAELPELGMFEPEERS
ncbi:MAG: hypothetical protein BWK80_41155 [Desulfobacteraceae bacterium IS3]|nr:MAG: hypothetical protein BWK80_41155 [Desulfobacteraceae bacterium IS3]